MHSPASLLPRPTRTPLVVLRPTPPVVVAWSTGDRAAIIRAAALAATGRAPLHLVVGIPRPPSPWARLAGRTGPALPADAPVLAGAERLRSTGLHVEVHPTTGRPSRLAREIARTVAGRLVD